MTSTKFSVAMLTYNEFDQEANGQVNLIGRIKCVSFPLSRCYMYSLMIVGASPR